MSLERVANAGRHIVTDRTRALMTLQLLGRSLATRKVSRHCEPFGYIDRHVYSRSIAISSDQYFGRGTYDPQASAEARTRLQNFSGATAISSNAYFGRPDEEDESLLAGEEGGLLGDLANNETVQQLERGVRDLAGRVMANPDVQQLGDSLRTGALRVSL